MGGYKGGCAREVEDWEKEKNENTTGCFWQQHLPGNAHPEPPWAPSRAQRRPLSMRRREGKVQHSLVDRRSCLLPLPVTWEGRRHTQGLSRFTRTSGSKTHHSLPLRAAQSTALAQLPGNPHGGTDLDLAQTPWSVAPGILPESSQQRQRLSFIHQSSSSTTQKLRSAQPPSGPPPSSAL